MTAPTTLKGGRYSIVGTLGSGAHGETLEAVDATTGTAVAIKRFVVRGARSWKDVELAEREARVLAALDHPSLPRYLDHFEEDGALCLVMQRVPGESLLAIRRRGGGFTRAQVLRLLADTGAVLDYLHERAPPIIHRDIKPGNLIHRPDGSFALVDFGSVRDSLKPEGGSTVVGTFGYMAPEQFQGRALPQSDVYALGATALALLTGQEPETLPHRGLAIDVLAALPHDPELGRVLARMLDPDPDRRATSVGPLLDALPRTQRSSTRAASEAARPSSTGTNLEPRRPLVPGPLLVFLFILGLIVARFSTLLLFRVFLPVLLTILSIVFGPGLRRAAGRLRRLGEQGDRGLSHAMEVVRGRGFRARRERRPGRRVRVEPVNDAEREAEMDPTDEADPTQRRQKRR